MANVEHELLQSANAACDYASNLRIENNEDYKAASGFLLEIKARAKAVMEYWKPLKEDAQKQHRAICEREKVMLAPLKDAETDVKSEIAKFLDAVEKAKKEAQEAARKAAQEEANRLLEKAADAENQGDSATASITFAMAQMVDEMPIGQGEIEAPRAKGVSVRKELKATVVDETLVPSYVNGIQIRKIDLSAINKMAKLYKGKIDIPGIAWTEESIVSATAR